MSKSRVGGGAFGPAWRGYVLGIVRRWWILFVACLTLAACSGGADDPPFEAAAVTTSTTVATTTTAPPPPPPTTAPAAARSLNGVRAPVVVSPRGVVLPVVRPEGAGLRVYLPCGGTTVITEGTPVAGAEVVLDPGHGGSESGAVGHNGLTEKAVNLEVAVRAQRLLEANGVPTVLTRAQDYRMTLGARTRIALALRPRAFVSVHHNGDPDGPHDGPGTETFYQYRNADSRRLAGLLYEEIFAALRQYQIAWVGDADAGAKYRLNSGGGDYYGVLRQSAGVPAVISEGAFITNPPEAELLARSDVQEVEARAVAGAIVRYLRTADPGSGYTEPYPRTTPAGPGGGARGCVDPAL
jgi:N-acetylmuramoyl-L-alanine amidase